MDEDPFNPIILCGLTNLGNTCFLNSALQALTACKPFIVALRCGMMLPPMGGGGNASSASGARLGALDRWKLLAGYSAASRHYALRRALAETVDAMQYGADLVIAPKELVRAAATHNAQFAVHGQQQDAAEWLHTVVDAVDECEKVEGHARGMLAALCKHDAAADKASENNNNNTQQEEDNTTTTSSTKKDDDPLWLWRILAQIDDENEALHRKSSANVAATTARGLPTTPPHRWTAPLRFRGPINDVFSGLYLSSILCHTCRKTTRTATEFTELQLAFPSEDARAAYFATVRQATTAREPMTENSQATTTSSVSGGGGVRSVAHAVLSVLSSTAQWIWRCIAGGYRSDDYGPLSLDELLWHHCRPERLTGSNRYHCDYCGGAPQDATKTIDFLSLPEQLVIQLKRFSSEGGRFYWTSSKIRDYVAFPINAPESRAAASSSPLLLDLRAHLSPAARPTVSTYALNAVINHHGTLLGGHYTAYCERGDGQWVLHNDSKAARVDPKTVAESQAYVLVYRKKQCQGRGVPTEQHRAAAQRLLLRGVSTSAGNDAAQQGSAVDTPTPTVYVSKIWLMRLASFAEPGPITNAICTCDEARRRSFCASPYSVEVDDDSFPSSPSSSGASGALTVDRSNRHFHLPAELFYVPVSRTLFDEWRETYGGGPVVTASDYLALWQAETRWCGAILKATTHQLR